MELTVDKAVFAESVAWAARVLPNRPASPILAGLRIEAGDDNTVHISGFDYEVSAREQIYADVNVPGTILVAGRLLADITRALPGSKVSLRTIDGRVEIKSGNASYWLQEMPISEYPNLPNVPETIGHISAEIFKEAVGKVAFAAASREEANPVFTGVKLDFTSEVLSMFATDKVRLAKFDTRWQGAVPGNGTPVVIKAKVMQDVAKSLPADANAVEIGLSIDGGINLVSFKAGNRISTSQLIDGGYPNVLGLFADSYPIKVSVAKEALLNALKRVALVSEREVILKFRQGEVELAAGQGDEANAAEIIPCELHGEDITIALRPSFLTDGLNALDLGFASLNLTHPIKPVEMRGQSSIGSEDDTQFRYLFVPIRLAA
jgi:DNA polymerase-3 subunit beta